ncbi:MAG: hypothetical protein LBH58_07695 [Tannerellaceae bacterium]|jgi:nitrogen fixation protein NifX|nr:hypothetical protein [Tannerellaceae bacterium]
MSYRIAIASSNGESIDQHFGQAENFLIYEITTDGAEFIEDREVTNVGQEKKQHSDSNISQRTDLLHDCKAVFVLKIGMRSSRYLYEHKISSFEVNFPINRVLNTLVNNFKKGKVRII